MPLSLEGIVQTSKEVLYSALPFLPEYKLMRSPNDDSFGIGMFSALAKAGGLFAIAVGSILGAGPVDVALVIAGAAGYATGAANTSYDLCVKKA